jgi:pectate lyase
VNGFLPQDRVDVVAAWNEVNDPDLLTTVGWTPTLFRKIDPTRTVPFAVEVLAGPFFWFLD